MPRTVMLPYNDAYLAQLHVCVLFLSVKETAQTPQNFVSISFLTHAGQHLPPAVLCDGAQKDYELCQIISRRTE